MTGFFSLFKRVNNATLRPSGFFTDIKKNDFFRGALISAAAILVIATVILFLTSLITPDFKPVMKKINPLLQNQGIHVRGRSPWSRLFFPVYWILYLAIGGFIRHLVTVMLGEKERSLKRVIGITMYAAVPLIISGMVLGILNNLHPLDLKPFTGSSTASWIHAIFAVAIFLGTLVWEGIICSKGLRAGFDQNQGRAILTWLSPLLLLSIITCGSVIILPLLFS